MDINDIRSLVTLTGFVAFVGLLAWTWRPVFAHSYAAAARLPLEGDATGSLSTVTQERSAS